jgi:hypothetical protein
MGVVATVGGPRPWRSRRLRFFSPGVCSTLAFARRRRPQTRALWRTVLRTQGQSVWSRLGAHSSAVEHLPYKQAVTGSIPVAPTSFLPVTVSTDSTDHEPPRGHPYVGEQAGEMSGQSGCSHRTFRYVSRTSEMYVLAPSSCHAPEYQAPTHPQMWPEE